MMSPSLQQTSDSFCFALNLIPSPLLAAVRFINPDYFDATWRMRISSLNMNNSGGNYSAYIYSAVGAEQGKKQDTRSFSLPDYKGGAQIKHEQRERERAATAPLKTPWG